MQLLPANPNIERRNEGYYIAGTRISLESIAYALRRGETVPGILADFPVIASREKLEAVVALNKDQPREVEAYLVESSRRWQAARKLNPPDLTEKARLYRKTRDLKPA
jgi:uncharacterized protein (DUF433 family)